MEWGGKYKIINDERSTTHHGAHCRGGGGQSSEIRGKCSYSAEKASVWSLFLEKFKDPLIIILLFAGVLSIGIACYEYYGLHHGATVFFEPVGIFVAIFLATAVSFYFEREADKQFSILNQVHDDEPVEVIRDGNVTSIPKREVVVGDIVVLPTGAEIPADGELLEAVSLSVDESSLTGEPVCRKSIHPEDFDPNATFATNRVLRGTKVMEGHGRMRVTAVGDATENGKVFEAAQIDNSVRTPLNEQLDRLGLLVTNVSYVFAALIIVGRLIVFFDWAPWSGRWLCPRRCSFTSSSAVSSAGAGRSRPWLPPATSSCCWP